MNIININQYRINDHQYMNTPKFYMLIGLLCSGKSTYALKLSIDNDAKIIASDSVREELSNQFAYTKEDNEKVFQEVYKRAYQYLRCNNSIILDATNISRAYRSNYLHLAKQYGFKCIAIVLNTPLETCIDRNKHRPKKKRISRTKMLQLNKYYEKPSIDEGFQDILYV